MAPLRNNANHSNDDLDDLFNFLDADNNDAAQTNQPPQPQEANTAPNRRRLDGDNPLGLGLGIDEEVKVRKPRAPIAKLDEDRLLSEKGIPTLRRITKERLRFKGKGHEYQYISKLLNTYQLWLDSLFPKANFADGAAMIEKLGHKKRMQVMRKAWIDEDRPKAPIEDDTDFIPREQQAQEPGDGDISMFDAQDTQVNSSESATGRTEAGITQVANELRSSSPLMLDDEDLYNEPVDDRTSTSVAREEHEPDEDELDALLAEDALREKSANVSSVRPLVLEKDDFADEEEAMAELGMW